MKELARYPYVMLFLLVVNAIALGSALTMRHWSVAPVMTVAIVLACGAIGRALGRRPPR